MDRQAAKRKKTKKQQTVDHPSLVFQRELHRRFPATRCLAMRMQKRQTHGKHSRVGAAKSALYMVIIFLRTREHVSSAGGINIWPRFAESLVSTLLPRAPFTEEAGLNRVLKEIVEKLVVRLLHRCAPAGAAPATEMGTWI
jgi:hypothetical protein